MSHLPDSPLGLAPRGTAGRLTLACASLFLLLAAGCHTRPGADIIVGPSYRPANIYGRNWSRFATVRRLAVLPVAADIKQPDLDAGRTVLEPILQRELGKTHRFEVVPISAEDVHSWSGRSSLSTAAPLPPNVLAKIREKYGCEAVLFPELTHFRPYPPLVVGWNLKLVEAQTGEILWAADEVFDASQPAVAAGARRYQAKHSLVRSGLADSRLVLLSPAAFGDYTAATLLAGLER